MGRLPGGAGIFAPRHDFRGANGGRSPDYSSALYRSEVIQCFRELLNQLDEKSRVRVGFAPALLPALHGSRVGPDGSGKEGT